MQALLLSVGADRYALALTDVCEVVRAPEITPLPGAPAAALGVMNLRGDVVPVLDVAALLGTGSGGADAPFAAVAGTDAGLAALATDAEPTTLELFGTAGRAELPAAKGRYVVADGVVTLLDVGALVGGIGR